MTWWHRIAVYATRYAVGRRSGAAIDVANFIIGNLDSIRADAGCRAAILAAIHEAPSLGDECDAKEWRMVLSLLDQAAA